MIIQLRKFAQAAKRIKAAVGSEASPPKVAKAVAKGQVSPGDLSDILSTEIRGGMDTSVFGKDRISVTLYTRCLVAQDSSI